MKRYIIYSFLIFLAIPAYSQYEIDALRFSQTFPSGTSKSISMGGAMGAVGADFSGISINPGSIGFYSSNELSFSIGMLQNTAESRFFGETYKDDLYRNSLSNLGLTFTRKQ